jgi:hypothetical protein
MRCRTAALSCFGLIGVMFAYPALVLAIFLPSLKQGLPNPLPLYEKALLDVAVLCLEWRWLLLLPLLGLGLTLQIADATRSQARPLAPPTNQVPKN